MITKGEDMKLQKYVNRIRCEAHESFDESAFKSVYEMVASLTKKIILANNYYEGQEELEKFCNENQIPTIISFLGDRGVGKSSAMLSFAYFLHSYNQCQIKENSHYWLSDNINFYVLPKIDAAMLTHEEGLFDVALAKMWDVFLEKVERSLKREPVQEQVRRKFEEVKHSYNNFRADKKEKGVSQLTELHELSQGLNLREDFCKLIDVFSKYMDEKSHKDSYVVFAIDDLDMVTANTYLKLEELRLLLTIPKVIVLITADLEHLILSTYSIWKRQLEEQCVESSLLRDYSVKYLAKVLPRNMRIFMPCSKETADIGLQEAYVEILDLLFKEKTKQSLTIQKLIDIFIRKQIGLSLYYEGMLELDTGMSLRETVDILAELEVIASESEREAAKIWMRKEILISSNRISEPKQKELIKNISEVNRAVFDLYFRTFYVEVVPWREMSWLGYRATIERLVDLCDEKPEWYSFEKLLIWNYGLKVQEELEKDKSVLTKELKENCFLDILIDNSFHTITQPQKHIENCFNKICKSNKPLEDVYSELNRLFLTLLFFDIETVLDNAIIKEVAPLTSVQSDEEKNDYSIIWDSHEGKNVQGGFYWFFSNLVTYEKQRKHFVDWVKKTWPKDYFGTLKYTENTTLMSKVDDAVLVWKEKYEKYDFLDIIPLHDIGTMMSIVNRLQIFVSGGEKLNGAYECLLRTVKIIKEAYAESEQYYNVFDSMTSRYGIKYEDLFDELLSIIELEEFSKAFYFSIMDKRDENSSVTESLGG